LIKLNKKWFPEPESNQPHADFQIPNGQIAEEWIAPDLAEQLPASQKRFLHWAVVLLSLPRWVMGGSPML
jgi:hypothetical protein